MSKWHGKSRGNVTGYKILVSLVKYTRLSFVYFILRFIVFYFVIFSFNSLRYIYYYFHSIHKYGFIKSVISIFKNYFLFAQTLIDKFAVHIKSNDLFSYEFEGEEFLHKIAAQKKGGILLSAHIGNWDIAGKLLERINTQINIVIFDGEHARIKNFISTYIKNDVKFIIIKKDLTHIYQIDQAIKNNELICMHGDRFVKDQRVREADFLGGKAFFPLGAYSLAVKYNIPISFVFAVKDNKYHYHFYATELFMMGKSGSLKGKEKNINYLFYKYLQTLEKMVKRYPLQWFNYYDFWNKRCSKPL